MTNDKRDPLPTAAVVDYADITIGSVYSFERKIVQNDVLDFAGLSGDYNPLHVDPDFGAKSDFKKNIVHGMLAGCFFSTLVGMYCPGEKSLFLSQEINFRHPLFVGDSIIVRATVVGKTDSLRMVTLKTEIVKNGKIAVDGMARVLVRNYEHK